MFRRLLSFVLLACLAVGFSGCGKKDAGIAGTWKCQLRSQNLTLTFNDDGSVIWERDGSGMTLLPSWLFYGKWKAQDAKLIVFGDFQGKEETQEWTYALSDGGKSLELIDANGTTLVMTKMDNPK